MCTVERFRELMQQLGDVNAKSKRFTSKSISDQMYRAMCDIEANEILSLVALCNSDRFNQIEWTDKANECLADSLDCSQHANEIMCRIDKYISEHYATD